MSTIVRLPRVIERTGLARSTIYGRIRDGSFPKPVSLGPRAVGWLISDIDSWIDHCVSSSRCEDHHNSRGL